VTYTFSGGSITGPTGFVKRGAGEAILANNNKYTGPTLVDSGWLRITGSLANNNTVTVGPSGGLAIDGNVAVRSITGGGLTFVGNGFVGASLSAGQIQQSLLNIGVNSQVTTWPGGGTSVLGALAIAGDPSAPAALFDLNNNSAVIDYTGASPVGVIRQQLLAGRVGTGLGGAWNGLGITSSAAAAANAANPESRSLGFAENASLPLGPYKSFRGQAVDGTAVLLAYTRTGDANLDGIVNDDDVTVMGVMYAPGIPDAVWANGDFDYNGFVDDDDVTILGVFYDPSAQPLSSAPSNESTSALSPASAVPEPHSFALLLFSVGILLAAGKFRARRTRAHC